MSNLFAVFSPERWHGVSLMWMAIGLPVLMMPKSLWIAKSRSQHFLRLINLRVTKEIKSGFGAHQAPGTGWLFVRLFLFIGTINLSGLIPYVFTPTTHLRITLGLGLPIWLGTIRVRWGLQPIFIFAHLAPRGTPITLLPFMVIIEVLSTLIRPLTLAVRLAANIIAGHLLFALLRGCASPNNGLENLIYILVLIPLGVLELTVALIQAFVFSLLSRLYVQETQSTLLMAKTSVTVEVRAIV